MACYRWHRPRRQVPRSRRNTERSATPRGRESVARTSIVPSRRTVSRLRSAPLGLLRSPVTATTTQQTAPGRTRRAVSSLRHRVAPRHCGRPSGHASPPSYPRSEPTAADRSGASLAGIQGDLTTDQDGTGSATFTLNQGHGQICYDVAWSGLGTVSGLHIHLVADNSIVVPLDADADLSDGNAKGCVTASPRTCSRRSASIPSSTTSTCIPMNTRQARSAVRCRSRAVSDVAAGVLAEPRRAPERPRAGSSRGR